MILLTGATGTIGRELVHALAARDVEFRIFVRDPRRADGLPERARRVVGDLDDPNTYAPALDGADRLFLLVPGIGLDHTRDMVAAARTAGVGRIVLLSSYNVMGDPIPAMGRWHHERESIVRAAGLPYTILRPGGLMTNALEWAPVIRAGGVVDDPTGPGRYAPVDPGDIAAVAAMALTEDGHDGMEYYLTGDEMFTIADQIAVIAAAIGHDIDVREAATPEQAVASRYPHGAPPALAAAILEGFTLMRRDTTGFRTDTIERLLGRRPRNFTDWCTRNIDAFRTNQTARTP
ncbi:NAD(P)H-binding protein [Nocardia sp. CA2R105]|uniref:SDR family oxidoreductase n=1 Tax=Nocardia coffeae TaxID=2873381 RepID=UPI001CA762CC|nr:NAD(P)H-binding protein [Nocardia coffeae]MBY8860770.1 NAD(P)H-binding protein [Nocardia coffeae]